nr:hypothetical protein CFP56_49648 [Quercus suber]
MHRLWLSFSIIIQEPTQYLTQPPACVCWHPSIALLLKVNFNGATFRDLNVAGLGVVIQDSKGRVKASLSKKINLPPSFDDAEALVAVRAIHFAQDLDLFALILEGDPGGHKCFE